jgi:hypothetical protein
MYLGYLFLNNPSLLKGMTMYARRMFVSLLLVTGSVLGVSQVALAAHASTPNGTAANPIKAQLVADSRQETCSAGTTCQTVSAGNNTVGVIDAKQSFGSIPQVCVTFGFGSKDALATNDAINIQFRDPVSGQVYDPMSVINVGSASQTTRTTCVTADSRPDLAHLFLAESNLKIYFSVYAQSGSVWLSSVNVFFN